MWLCFPSYCRLYTYSGTSYRSGARRHPTPVDIDLSTVYLDCTFQKMPPCLRIMRFSQTTNGFLSQDKRKEGTRSVESESVKRKKYKERVDGEYGPMESISRQQPPECCVTSFALGAVQKWRRIPTSPSRGHGYPAPPGTPPPGCDTGICWYQVKLVAMYTTSGSLV